MKLSLDRTLRIIWLLIGILLLGFLLVGGGMIVVQMIGNMGASDAAVRLATDSTARREEPRAIRFDEPKAIYGTGTRLVQVRYGRGYEPENGYGFGGGGTAASGRYKPEITANVAFLDAAGARLLLDRPAYIAWIGYPQNAQQVQRWIEYSMALDDTNRDGRLDSRDGLRLYVSDLEGRNLRPVLRAPLLLHGTQVLDAQRMLIYALEPPSGQEVKEDRMRQRAFIYEVPSGRLSPYAALDSVAERAGRILQR